MIYLYNENIVSDLRKYSVSLPDDIFDAINEFIDIENSTATPITVDRWQDVRGKTVLFTDNGEVLALYHKDKFNYNPHKVKVSDAPNYDLYQIDIGGTNVVNRRLQRQDDLSGLTATADSSYVGTPTSTQYIYDKDWNPEVNKRYYAKLLQRRHLNKYIAMLEDAYDCIVAMIKQRKERQTGKRTLYNRMIGDIQRQVSKIEDMLVNAERDRHFEESEIEKLKKEVSKLPGLVKKARDFMDTEAAEYATWGKRKDFPLEPIRK